MEYKITKLESAFRDDFVKEYFHSIVKNERVNEVVGNDLYVEYKDFGIVHCFNSDSYELKAIFLYSGNFEGYSRFTGAVIENVKFEMSKNDIIELLGEPDRSINGIDLLNLPPQYIYSREKYSLSIFYDLEGMSILYFRVSFEFALL